MDSLFAQLACMYSCLGTSMFNAINLYLQVTDATFHFFVTHNSRVSFKLVYRIVSVEKFGRHWRALFTYVSQIQAYIRKS